MKSRDSAPVPAREMDRREVAESDEWLGIQVDRCEVEAVNDAIGTLATCRREHGAHTWIAKGLVQILQTVLVSTREVMTPGIEGVGRNLDLQSPIRQDGRSSLYLLGVGPTRG